MAGVPFSCISSAAFLNFMPMKAKPPQQRMQRSAKTEPSTIQSVFREEDQPQAAQPEAPSPSAAPHCGQNMSAVLPGNDS